MGAVVYPESFVGALPEYDKRRVNRYTVWLTRKSDPWMVRRRERIEELYQAIGGNDADLLGKLREDDKAEAAEFELLVYAAIRSRNIRVEWGPTIEGKKPDLG